MQIFIIWHSHTPIEFAYDLETDKFTLMSLFLSGGVCRGRVTTGMKRKCGHWDFEGGVLPRDLREL